MWVQTVNHIHTNQLIQTVISRVNKCIYLNDKRLGNSFSSNANFLTNQLLAAHRDIDLLALFIYSLYDTEEVDIGIVNSEVIEHSSGPSLDPQFLT